jgi:putative transposase
MAVKRRRRVEHTEDWGQLELLLNWPEQVEYERIRDAVVFGDPVTECAEKTATAERTFYRRVESFDAYGMEGLIPLEPVRGRRISLAMRLRIVELKAEYPPFSLGEIARICYALFGKEPSKHTVKRIIEEGPTPLLPPRRYATYHQMPPGKERRKAIVALHVEGWTAKAIAGYLETSQPTVYGTLRRWASEGEAGLEDRPRGRPAGVRKVDLRTYETVRKLQKNPGLGAYRMQAALEQLGIYISRATCGRIMAINRRVYGLKKPDGSAKAAKEMPFRASRRHQYWSTDIRYIDHGLPDTGNVYSITIMDNYSRAILWGDITTRQDLPSFLSILYRAIEHYGSPEALVTDSGSVFLANRARAIYAALGIEKHEIEKGNPYQNYSETTFGIQKRMADHYFSGAENWQELVAVHNRWMEDYNAQRHFAHEQREDGRRSPVEVLGFLTGIRYHPEDLQRAFFSTRYVRVLDPLGYARLMHWRVYGEEALAAREAALWLDEKNLTVEYQGETLSRYEIALQAETGKLREVKRPQLFETAHRSPQLRLFDLGEIRWLTALRANDYAPRGPFRPQSLQEALFPYAEAL